MDKSTLSGEVRKHAASGFKNRYDGVLSNLAISELRRASMSRFGIARDGSSVSARGKENT